MLRISALIGAAVSAGAVTKKAHGANNHTVPAGSRAPIVIWNLTRNCNLTCVHCYAAAQPRQFSGELTLEQALKTAEDMAEAGVKMVVLSGGEPLFRQDIFQIAERLVHLGVTTSLSSNGTLFDKPAIEKIAKTGFSYVGVSLDGLGDIHDKFRGLPGSFVKAVEGVRNVKAAGLKSGVRFTITKMNIGDVNGMFDLAEELKADKLYFSHLVYSGRGNGLKDFDLTKENTRKLMDLIMDKAVKYAKSGNGPELVTGNNDADAVYLYMRVVRDYPAAADRLMQILKLAGGASAGIGVANIDARGAVHPDPLMSSVNLGNVTEKTFKEIWFQNPDPTLARLRRRPQEFNGRCGSCRWIPICGGSTRVRAQRLADDLWGSDPACYLTDEEIQPAESHAFA
ncbi:MAG: radical SAM protein [Nitrospinota bacterium]|nr:radical SAM protein [Nitrospinota bacterium]